MIADSARYLGCVLSCVVDNSDGPVIIQRIYDGVAGFYMLNDKVPMFIKYTTKRHSPWSFTFTRSHQVQQQTYRDQFGECLMVFVCGQDGIVALSHDNFRNVLNENFESQESVIIKRRHAKMYQISGRDGKLGHKVGRNSLTEILYAIKNQ